MELADRSHMKFIMKEICAEIDLHRKSISLEESVTLFIPNQIFGLILRFKEIDFQFFRCFETEKLCD